MKLRSIRQKFFIGVLLTSLSALLVAGGAMVFYDLRAYHAAQVRELRTLAELTGQATAVGLQFDDRKFAVDYLNLLQSHRKIDAAALYNAKGGLFASYVRQGSSHVQLPNLPDPDLVRISGRNLEVFRRIVENNEIIGTVYLTARYEVYESLWSYLGIVLGVGAFALGVSVLLSYWLQNRITGPILEVTEVARHVVEQRNFDARAAKTTDDEVGYLVDAFNDMLKEIARQTEALKASNLELEARIRERTEAVTALRSSERRNRALIDAMTSFVWTADPRRAFVDPQPAWSDYTGQPEEDYRGSGWRRAFHSDDKSRIEAHWSHAAAERAPFECEVRLWHAKSSSYRTVSVRAAPVSSQDNAISEWIGSHSHS
jgi:PAS domain S-box-containing protein